MDTPNDGIRPHGSDPLPNRRPDRLWGGMGTGAACAFCAAEIPREQIEFELLFEGEGTYRMHTHCFTAWEAARCPADGLTDSAHGATLPVSAPPHTSRSG